MSIRTRTKLMEDQAALLDVLRQRGGAGVELGVAESPDAVTTIAKVTGIVTSDATYGAHLTVRPQQFTGTPPAAGNAAKPILRAYPTPNHVVTDYAVNDFVLLLTARGGLLAGKMS